MGGRGKRRVTDRTEREREEGRREEEDAICTKAGGTDNARPDKSTFLNLILKGQVPCTQAQVPKYLGYLICFLFFLTRNTLFSFLI